MENNGLSPNPVVEGQINQELSFPEAIAEIINGHKVTRREWNNTDYGFLKDEWLMIHKNGEDFVWKVSRGDMVNNDWIVL